MGSHISEWAGGVSWIACLVLLLSEGSWASTSCGFTAGENLCKWTPKVLGSAWQTGLIAGLAPPIGSTSYAYTISGQESWAELESQVLSVTSPAHLTFAVIQTRIDVFSPDDFVKLLHVAADGSSSSVIWSTKNSLNWEYGSVVLRPEFGAFRLRFMFKVGNERNRAALGRLILDSELTTTTLSSLTTLTLTNTTRVTPMYSNSTTAVFSAAMNSTVLPNGHNSVTSGTNNVTASSLSLNAESAVALPALSGNSTQVGYTDLDVTVMTSTLDPATSSPMDANEDARRRLAMMRILLNFSNQRK